MDLFYTLYSLGVWLRWSCVFRNQLDEEHLNLKIITLCSPVDCPMALDVGGDARRIESDGYGSKS